jgi:hypothetical protein
MIGVTKALMMFSIGCASYHMVTGNTQSLQLSVLMVIILQLELVLLKLELPRK